MRNERFKKLYTTGTVPVPRISDKKRQGKDNNIKKKNEH